MKIELALFNTDERKWEGMVMVEGELFKVTIFPGSATEEWKAVLMTGAFVELTPENKLTQAIEVAYGEYNKPYQTLKRSEVDELAKLVAEKPEMLEEIMEILKGR